VKFPQEYFTIFQPKCVWAMQFFKDNRLLPHCQSMSMHWFMMTGLFCARFYEEHVFFSLSNLRLDLGWNSGNTQTMTFFLFYNKSNDCCLTGGLVREFQESMRQDLECLCLVSCFILKSSRTSCPCDRLPCPCLFPPVSSHLCTWTPLVSFPSVGSV